jgi:tetratricopeptide (TPR) repeat protein
MSDLKRLVRDLHRRSLWQVLLVYLTASWVVYQIALDLAEGLGLPDWVAPTVLILLMVGLPVVLATAFIQEGTPGQSDGGPIEPGTPAVPSGPLGTAEATPSPDPPASRSVAAEPGGSPWGYFTWRNAIVAGVGAFALLGLVVVLFMGSRMLGIGPAATLLAQGALEEDARILLADVGGAPADSGIAEMVTEALRVDLEQSDVVRLAEPRLLRDALRRMQRDSTAPLSEEVALELAVREGIPAVLTTDLHRAGGAIVLSSRLVPPGGEGALASFRQTAQDSTDIVDAVDRLSADIRAKIGESLRSIRGSPPLERVTTASLPALRRYSTAVRILRADPESREAAALLEQAVAVDSTFAMAWLQLGRLYGFYSADFDSEREGTAISRAWEHSERLSPRERLLAEAWYHDRVRSDEEAQRAALERLLAEHPEDVDGLNEWFDLLMDTRQYDAAADVLDRLLAIDSTWALVADGEWMVAAFRGDAEGAVEALDRYEARFPADSLYVLNQRAHLAAQVGEYERADRLWRELEERGRETTYPSGALFSRAYMQRGFGRLEDYVDLRVESGRAYGMTPTEERFERAFAELASRAWLGLPIDAEFAAVRRALEAGALDSIPGEPELGVAAVLAIAGEPAEGRRVLDAWLATAADSVVRGARMDIANARGEIALAEGRFDEALAAFREVRETAICPECGLVDIGRVHDAAGRPDAAIAAWEEYLATPNPYRVRGDGQNRAPLLERLAELYEARGDVAKARSALAEFVRLWENADSELQPRVEAARRRLQTLVDRESG